MHGQAQIWRESKERDLATLCVIIAWVMFLKEMQNQYIPSVVKDRKATEFANLVQGSMMVTKYDTKFEELSKYAPTPSLLNEIKH